MSVMNNKIGVKAFGETGVAPTSTNATAQPMTSEDFKKLGGDNMGEVLNKMSDPNWVDPSKKMRTVGNDKLDKDAFFKLMIAQIKHQDPTNPMKSHEMAAQLANFSSLEQMQNMNTTLQEMKNGQKPLEQFQALNFIGKSVAGDSGKLVRAKGDTVHDFRFDLPDDAKEAKIQVRNSDGEVVKTLDLKSLRKGPNKITWNGQDEKGNKTPEGEYRFSIGAISTQGRKLMVKTEFDGIITGVNYTAEGPVLLVGNQSVRLKDVKKITDPAVTFAAQQVQKMETAAAPDLKNGEQPVQTDNNKGAEGEVHEGAKLAPVNVSAQPVQPVKVDEGAPEAPKKSKIMDNVGLSKGMMDQLNKELGPT